MGHEDEFGHFPDVDSNVAPSDLKEWSIAPDDAAAQAEADLATQTNLRKIAEQRATEIQARCKALQSKLQAAMRKKRKAKAIAAESSGAAATVPEVSPKKRATPSPQPLTDIMASQLPASPPDDSKSDDEVGTPEETYAKQPTFEQLNSILCEYKAGRVCPTFDGNISFQLCAELCEEEADEIDGWSAEEKLARRPMIISALRITYKDKREEWFSKPFLLSPSGSAQYWQRVLRRRAQIWRASHEKHLRSMPATNSCPPRTVLSVQDRIRAKLSEKTPPSASRAPDAKAHGLKTIPIVISSSDDRSGDSSDDDQDDGDSSDVTQRKRTRKTAPDPNKHYSISEVKKFANMAKTIKNVDEAKGHSHAVADFIDLEFSGVQHPHLLACHACNLFGHQSLLPLVACR